MTERKNKFPKTIIASSVTNEMQKIIIFSAIIAVCLAAPAPLLKDLKEDIGEQKHEIGKNENSTVAGGREKRCEKHHGHHSEKQHIQGPNEPVGAEIRQSDLPVETETEHLSAKPIQSISTSSSENIQSRISGKMGPINEKNENAKNLEQKNEDAHIERLHNHHNHEVDHQHDHVAHMKNNDDDSNKKAPADEVAHPEQSSSSSTQEPILRHKPVPVSELFSRPKVNQ